MGDKMSENIGSMNLENSLSLESKLFGLIAESAQTNRIFVLTNKLIKENSVNAMMIPMNIRSDDFYFTITNMKRSHVDGAYIAQEYQEEVVELLDEKDEIVEAYGRCDLVIRDGEKLKGFLIDKNDVDDIQTISQIIFDKFIKGEK
jgi:shikimate 5-dehydrogenase